MISDADLLKQWWIENSRSSFYAYRLYIRAYKFLSNWYIKQLSTSVQKFYEDYKAGKRPILIISTPPQHGKSWAIEDAACWMLGQNPDLRMVFASFSERLGIRCNTATQRTMVTEKYKEIFPDTSISKTNVVTLSNLYKRNSSLIEMIGNTGSFRNTTVGGPITGESLDIGLIDDPFKGRKEANSIVVRNSVWDWFTDDFSTRLDDKAGIIITMTRWHRDDLVGRLIEKYKGENSKSITYFKYEAIAERDEKFRKAGGALFPKLKSLKFLKIRKSAMAEASWKSLYQGTPVIAGGNMIKSHWWQWWERLPQLKFTFAVADTAQKTNNWNDFTVFQLWGYGIDDCIYLIDMFYEKVTAPDLRTQAEIFYRKHDKENFRGFYIEDKSSGIGLIQELTLKKLKVFGIPRNVDKVERAYNVAPEIRAGKVYLNAAVPNVKVVTEQASEFPNGKFDDAWDCTMNGVEAAFVYPETLNYQVYVA